MKYLTGILFIIFTVWSCKKDPPLETGALQLISVSVGVDKLSLSDANTDLPYDKPIVIRFSQAIDTSTVIENVSLVNNDNVPLDITFSFLDNDKTISLSLDSLLHQKNSYSIHLGSGLIGKMKESFPGIILTFSTKATPLSVVAVSVDGQASINGSKISNISFEPTIEIQFSEPITAEQLNPYTSVVIGSITFNHSVQEVSDTVLRISIDEELPYFRKVKFNVSEQLSDAIDKEFAAFTMEFYTMLDTTDKFPRLSDLALLDLIQSQTFKYFWDFAHPVSGLIRERNTSSDNVTSGGSGFGIMALPIGIERGFISREEGILRLQTIVDFLAQADRFHGAWSHWLSGSSGNVNPFSSDDDGGDLVETSYLAMGLITARQYLNESDTEESLLIEKINLLLDEIEWDWYTQGENSLTWHWSPNVGFEKNMKIRGWNEALITYIMAATSSTHPISKEVYEQGWGGGTNMTNGKEFYGITLPLGPDKGGPLFFEQYTFIGLDPRKLSDQYANYWEQVVNHTLINRQYCIVNPLGYIGYSEDCWGLTASDGNKGYSAHSPTNDRGVITPSAALSSIPFTPEESMDVMRYFYYKLGDRVWGPYGFYDAFNVTDSWYGTSNIAIDQGPILLMIENYRTALLWDLFMSAPEVQSGLGKLGFAY